MNLVIVLATLVIQNGKRIPYSYNTIIFMRLKINIWAKKPALRNFYKFYFILKSCHDNCCCIRRERIYAKMLY